MTEIAQTVLSALEGMGIRYRLSAHAPTATMEACAEIDRALGALTPKNIFLTTKNRKRHYLCLARPEARFVTSDVSRQAGSSRLSFAPEEALQALLRCRSGAASPLGLIFDAERRVGLLVDRALLGCPTLAFHPCDNTLTAAMDAEDFFGSFLTEVGVEPVFVDM